ncbi:BMA-LIN-40, isoform a [Aphelenchoides bicaudatus]|nr:BMA-LIN-40, isoform a [Aphelenchoides bicaudatus]
MSGGAEVKKEPSGSTQLSQMQNNMYRVGDYVYFENFPSSPYNIRRIEELNKTPSGTVEAKVACFFRRRDLPSELLKIADKAERQNEIRFQPRRSLLSRKTVNGENGVSTTEGTENGVTDAADDGETKGKKPADVKEHEYGLAGLPRNAEQLESNQIHKLRQHELFLSRQVDTLPATQIRGKCAVVMLSEVETCDSYLNREDGFFYSLVFDGTNQTLLADKGKIDSVIDREREQNGTSHEDDINEENGDLQIDEPDAEPKEGEEKKPVRERRHSQNINGVYETRYESVVYHPHHELTDRDIDQFLIIARAVGTFSRALDTSSTIKLPSLHMTAAAASRDVALFHAMALLHQANYDIGQAVKFLVPPPSTKHYPLDVDKTTGHHTANLGGPILCRDQLEEWSAAEATLFEEAIEKCGKDFHDIRNDCLPWKSIRDIVEYYYMWKTTARYAETQRSKLAEQENKLKQVYIPNYNKPNPNLVGTANTTGEPVKIGSTCESCKNDSSTQWFSWGPSHLQLRLCSDCWVNWKKHGGLKIPHEFETYDLDGAADITTRGSQNRANLARSALNGTPLKAGSAQSITQAKGRAAFYLNTNLHAKVARGLAPKNIFNIRKAARLPNKPIDSKTLTTFYYSRDLNDVLRSARAIRERQNAGKPLPEDAVRILTEMHQKHGSQTA